MARICPAECVILFLQVMDEVDRMKNLARVEVIHPVKGHRFAIAVTQSFRFPRLVTSLRDSRLESTQAPKGSPTEKISLFIWALPK